LFLRSCQGTVRRLFTKTDLFSSLPLVAVDPTQTVSEEEAARRFHRQLQKSGNEESSSGAKLTPHEASTISGYSACIDGPPVAAAAHDGTDVCTENSTPNCIMRWGAACARKVKQDRTAVFKQVCTSLRTHRFSMTVQRISSVQSTVITSQIHMKLCRSIVDSSTHNSFIKLMLTL
jgi:hypothetical protein